jgi:hypothetical protein
MRSLRQVCARGPRSYLVSDMGRPGVPDLDRDEIATINQIQHYLRAKTLRFAFVGKPSQEFIVFNAKLGPCLEAAGGYQVLNEDCLDFYEPGEDPWYVKSSQAVVAARVDHGFQTTPVSKSILAIG